MPFSLLSLRVDPSELDAYGYVNAIAIVKYFQAARIHYFEEAGIIDHHKTHGIGPLVVSCKLDAKTPLFYPGQISIQSRMKKIGTSSFCMTHDLSKGSGELVVAAEETLVMFDFVKKTKMPFPPEIRTRIEALEDQTY